MKVSGEWYVFSKILYLINIHLIGTVLTIWSSIDEIRAFTGARDTWLNNIPTSVLVQRAR